MRMRKAKNSFGLPIFPSTRFNHWTPYCFFSHFSSSWIYYRHRIPKKISRSDQAKYALPLPAYPLAPGIVLIRLNPISHARNPIFTVFFILRGDKASNERKTMTLKNALKIIGYYHPSVNMRKRGDHVSTPINRYDDFK